MLCKSWVVYIHLITSSTFKLFSSKISSKLNSRLQKNKSGQIVRIMYYFVTSCSAVVIFTAFESNCTASTVVYIERDVPLYWGFLRAFRAFVGASIYNPYAAKIGVWIGCVHRIKVCLIPEIFCIVYRQKSIVAKRNFTNVFIPRWWLLENFLWKRAEHVVSFLFWY